jgi:membrane-associated HD superfamily phosphohydrolase
MPFGGAIAYFIITPRFLPESIVQAKLLAIAILTIFIPMVFYFLLKNLGLAENMKLAKVKERRLPLLFFCLIVLTVLNFILVGQEFSILFNYYSGILYTTILALLLVIFKYKVSLHMMGIAGITTFIMSVSIIYSTNLTYIIAILVFSIGWTAASRIQEKAHTFGELTTGLFIGAVPQFLLLMVQLQFYKI